MKPSAKTEKEVEPAAHLPVVQENPVEEDAKVVTFVE